MRLWIGRPSAHGAPCILFASTGSERSAPRVLHHQRDGGFFAASGPDGTGFACDRCAAALVGLRVEDGMDIGPAALAEAFAVGTQEASGSIGPAAFDNGEAIGAGA